MTCMAQPNTASDQATNHTPNGVRRWSLRFSLRNIFGLLTAFCVSWGLTISVGVPDVSRYCWVALERNRDGDSARMDFDSMYDRESSPRPSVPWHYVGDGKAPFPFVVSIHVAAIDERGMGSGSRYYFVWVFGLKFSVWETTYWFGG